ncbi:hypothetical protein LEP1GSC024_4429 [Leptospira noguchii str. 2001034031]|uniref:Uncharacterized protein n=1 Tax=Leptospira noguchii str. 2001034031 TaxID=1193053 RepID=M6YFZ5_9LEPT|nr:hypothetical protein LEP1GSC024_4429 [Leptospira noguchii str. 2001034031]
MGIGTTGNSSIGKRCMSLAILSESSLSVFLKIDRLLLNLRDSIRSLELLYELLILFCNSKAL